MVVGKYVVERWLGEGGMGSVYLARHQTTGKRVALKRILDPSAEHAHARFIREARAAARVQHPNVVDVYDVIEEDDGLLCLVMEYLEGETLAARMVREPRLSEDESIRIALDIARALSAAHREQVVHRDLKPANVFLCRQDGEQDGEQRVKVLDFGLAKMLDETSSMSQSDRVVGTPHYMAPELILGAVEARASGDLYALGVILYELLAGVLPHDHERMTALLVDVATKPTPPLHTRCNVQRSLSDVVMKALAKNPADRYASVADFADALRAHSTAALPPSSKPAESAARALGAESRPRDRRKLGVVIALATLVFSALLWIATRRTSTPALASQSASQPRALVESPRAETEAVPSHMLPEETEMNATHEELPRSRPRSAIAPLAQTPPEVDAEAPVEAVADPTPMEPATMVEATSAPRESTSSPRAGRLSIEEF